MNEFDLNSARKIITDIEKRFPVNDWIIDDIHIWPLIRIKLGTMLAYQAFGSNVEKSINKQSKWDLIKRIFLSPFIWIFYSILDFKKTANPFRKRDVVFLGDGVSFTKIGNSWFQKNCDPYSLNFSKNGFSSIRFETWNKYYTPRTYPSFFIQVIIDWTILVSSFIGSKKSSRNSLEEYSSFGEYLKEIQINGNTFSEFNLKIHANKINTMANMYTYFLKKISPKIGLVVCYYGDYMMAFILACKRLKIPTFDIQHGVQGEKHNAYGNWTKIPEQGYSLLPDYFLCWSEYESKHINNWSQNKKVHKAINTGNRFLSMWKDPNSTMALKYDYLFDQIFTKKMPNILVTLSWDVSSEQHISSTLEVMKITQNEYNYLVRLHPSMLQQKQEIITMFHKHGIANFELEYATSLPLYALLRNIQLNITHSSSTVLECAEFDVKSVITSDYGWILLSDQVDHKYICNLDNCSEIKGFLKTLDKTRFRDKIDVRNNDNYIDELISIIKRDGNE